MKTRKFQSLVWISVAMLIIIFFPITEEIALAVCTGTPHDKCLAAYPSLFEYEACATATEGNAEAKCNFSSAGEYAPCVSSCIIH